MKTLIVRNQKGRNLSELPNISKGSYIMSNNIHMSDWVDIMQRSNILMGISPYLECLLVLSIDYD